MNESTLIEFLKKAVNETLGSTAPITIYLFGSRQGGDFHKTSDWDIAIKVSENEKNKNRFILYVHENIPTLNEIDIVDMNNCNEKLINEIIVKGKIIYEQKNEKF